jgi:hypothetical protein
LTAILPYKMNPYIPMYPPNMLPTSNLDIRQPLPTFNPPAVIQERILPPQVHYPRLDVIDSTPALNLVLLGSMEIG